MRTESAGGVVFYENSILLLRKQNGSWVLPKGHIEQGEIKEEAALREVYEEAGVEAVILEYLGEIEYSFKNYRINENRINKIVYWFIMRSMSDKRKPQTEEGFVEAEFFDMKEAIKLAKHSDERRIIEKAIIKYKEESKRIT